MLDAVGAEDGQAVVEGRYRLIRRIASGGMGDVYAAEQLSLRRPVALKLLRDELRAVPGMAERFRREALLMSTVDHPSVVRVIDFGQSPSAAWLVMEMVDGEPLDVRLERGPLSLSEAVHI